LLYVLLITSIGGFSLVASRTLEQVFFPFTAAIGLALGCMLLLGDQTKPKVRDSNLIDQKLRPEKMNMLFTFNRPMNQLSIEKGFTINPPVVGKFSWSGKRFSFTPKSPLAYDQKYDLQVTGKDQTGKVMVPFKSTITTPSRKFFYVGTAGSEKDHLFAVDFESKQQQQLTPDNQIVLKFSPHPDGNKVYYFAFRPEDKTGLLEQDYQSLYEVNFAQLKKPISQAVADFKQWSNIDFTLSPNGNNLLIQRLKKSSTPELGIWLLNTNKSNLDWQPFYYSQLSGDIFFTPDSGAMAGIDSGGLVIAPLSTEQQNKPQPEFITGYAQFFDFSADGQSALVSRYDAAFRSELVILRTTGQLQKLITTEAILSRAQFDPLGQYVYVILLFEPKQVEDREHYQLVRFDLKTGKQKKMWNQMDTNLIAFDLSPDGRYILAEHTKSVPLKSTLRRPLERVGGRELDSTVVLLDRDGKLIPGFAPRPGTSPQWN
jgi:Tol biopolymer transport system component